MKLNFTVFPPSSRRVCIFFTVSLNPNTDGPVKRTASPRVVEIDGWPTEPNRVRSRLSTVNVFDGCYKTRATRALYLHTITLRYRLPITRPVSVAPFGRIPLLYARTTLVRNENHPLTSRNSERLRSWPRVSNAATRLAGREPLMNSDRFPLLVKS